MEGNGGCCIAQYAGGGYDRSKIDRIMLRFRPIAPKPAVGGSVSGGSQMEKEVFVRTGRTKRRYVKDNPKRCNSRKRRVYSEEKTVALSETIVTLPLLPETPERKESPAKRLPSDLDLTANFTPFRNGPIWLSFNNPVMPQPVKPVGSCVTVECVTDTCVDGEGFGNTDEMKRKNLERDTCPGFISDGLNKVKWTNEAYRRMVGQGEKVLPEMVWLVKKETMPVTCPAFTCRVRLQYTCGKEKNSLKVPCDVWRMESGGFAWRLDVKAALSLGR